MLGACEFYLKGAISFTRKAIKNMLDDDVLLDLKFKAREYDEKIKGMDESDPSFIIALRERRLAWERVVLYRQAG